METNCFISQSAKQSNHKRSVSNISTGEARLGLSPLFSAVMSDNLDDISTLLKSGADASKRNLIGETPLHFASDNAQISAAKLLLAYGASVNAVSDEGEAVLHHASFRGDYEMVKLLISYRADLDVQNYASNKTALHFALEGNFLYCASLLISHGASISIEDSDGVTPYDLLKQKNALWALVPQREVSSVYLETIVEARATDEDAITPWRNSNNDLHKRSTLPIASSSLFDFLEELDAEKYTFNFIHAGFESLEDIENLMDTPRRLTIEKIRSIGVTEIGLCVRILLKLDNIAGVMPDVLVRHPVVTRKQFNCCGDRSFSYIFSINDWLENLGLEELNEVFNNAGYFSLETLLLQMHSKYPVTHRLLEDIGVTRHDHRCFIMNQLTQDCKLYMGRDIVQEKEQRTVVCNCIVF